MKAATADDRLYRRILDAIPNPIFLMDGSLQLIDFNTAASGMLTSPRRLVILRRFGEALHCLHSAKGCGKSEHCPDCLVRRSVGATLGGSKIVRQRLRMERVVNGAKAEFMLLLTTSPLQYEGRQLALVVLEDISDISLLRHLLPICESCKKVRDDRDDWHDVEHYFQTHHDVDFNRSLCPECINKLYPLR